MEYLKEVIHIAELCFAVFFIPALVIGRGLLEWWMKDDLNGGAKDGQKNA